MSAYPATSFRSDLRPTPVSSRSPSSHPEGLGSTLSSLEYHKIQSGVTDGLLSRKASQSRPRFAGLPYPFRSDDGDRSALMTDPDRLIDSNSELHSQPQRRFMMEGIPMGKRLTPSTDASPAAPPKPSGGPAEAEIQSEEEEELALTASEVEENGTDVGIARSAAERPTERRKLKRFRLVS